MSSSLSTRNPFPALYPCAYPHSELVELPAFENVMLVPRTIRRRCANTGGSFAH